MTNAICFKCGEEKPGALSVCISCGAIPKSDHELCLSMVLCEHLSTRAQLINYAHEIKNHFKLSAPEDYFSQAREALKDQQLIDMLRAQSALPPQLDDSNSSRARPAAKINHPQAQKIVPRSIHTTVLHKSPFAILGVTTRDSRKVIAEHAEEKSLEIDHDACQKARSDLTHPRNRLSAEIAWLPGISPRKASQLLGRLLHDPMAIREETALPTLAHCNLMAAAFEAVAVDEKAEDVAAFIQEMAYLVEELDLDEIVRDINEDRVVSGFPEIKTEQVENEILERKRFYKTAIKDALNRLPPQTLLDAITAAVDSATGNGEYSAPELIDELVDSYAVEVQGILEREAENVKTLVSEARSSAKMVRALAGNANNSTKYVEEKITPLIEQIEKVARNWDRIAQPIQLSAKARGIEHDHSHEVAYAIRNLAIDLFNSHDMLTSSNRLTVLIQELFAELPEVAELADRDIDTLTDIHAKREQAKRQSLKREAEWARAVTFSSEVGLVFKDTLSISPDGVFWKGNRYPLEAITAVRWGAVRHSVNGVPTGTDFTIGFATRGNSTVIKLKKESIYNGFLEALWRAVCIRLMIEMCETLEEGRSLNFGNIQVEDRGAVLIKHKLFGSNEKIRLSWDEVKLWRADGELVIGSKSDKKTYSSASYMNHWNTHLLDHVISEGFKKGLSKLSDYFKD